MRGQVLSLKFVESQPDSGVVALARAGHERALETLVRRYRSELLASCRRVAPEAASAEDVLQQTLLQAWRALQSGTEVRDVRPWLYRIAHNVAVSLGRAHLPAPCALDDVEATHDTAQVCE